MDDENDAADDVINHCNTNDAINVEDNYIGRGDEPVIVSVGDKFVKIDNTSDSGTGNNGNNNRAPDLSADDSNNNYYNHNNNNDSDKVIPRSQQEQQQQQSVCKSEYSTLGEYKLPMAR